MLINLLASILATSTLLTLQPADKSKENAPAKSPEKPAEKTADKPADKPAPSVKLVFPHPLITEILYNVPNSADGDANGDGDRSATGDEFIELVNPHDKPINLKGYTITDGRDVKYEDDPSAKPGPDGKKPKKAKVQKPQFEFTFPDLTLQPGEVIVLFNGYKQKWAQPVGDKGKAAAKNAKFHNAYIFSLAAESQFIGLNNDGDCIQLFAPGAKESIDCLWWGKPEEAGRDPSSLIEKLPESKGSVHRVGLTTQWLPSPELTGTLKGLFSPGMVELPHTAQKEPAKESAKPAVKPASKPTDKSTDKPASKPETKPETKPAR